MTEQTPAFRFIDLFAGIGGFHHALSDPTFGGECVLASDIDDKCRDVYAATWPEMKELGRIRGNIREITRLPDGSDRPLNEIDEMVDDHQVLCAGFPCQPFSKSGAQLGVKDTTRGTLFFDILQIVQAKQPRFLILENVRNIAGPQHKDTWRTIIASLREAGYRVADDPVVMSPHLISPADGGSPQSRDRVFILATRVDDGGPKTERPLVERAYSADWDPNNWRIEEYLQDDDTIENIERYQLRADETAWLTAWQAFVKGIESDQLPGFPIWLDEMSVRPRIPAGTPPWKENFIRKNCKFYADNKAFIDTWRRVYRVNEFPASRRKFEWQARSVQPTRKDRDLWKLAIHLRPSGIRVKPANYLPALVAITQTSIIGSRRRRITPVEAGRLQGVPDHVFPTAGVDDSTAYKQAGNGVNVGVVQAVARALFADNGVAWGTEEESDRGEAA
ncbi:DNA (cytosine-5-)-methyltransferase [Terrabacter sp. 2RAF25]|uniref:DNA (cytosine-5-)-methyltransferase n=1 Tax=Terrabacter sp. 2RAF25 TaxID=3232998 RepID=UPI003F99E139